MRDATKLARPLRIYREILTPGGLMSYMPYLADRAEVSDAADLIRLFGDGAGFEAASRADKSRDVGNHLHFCRWRQIERLIVLMSINRAIGTVH